MGMAARLPERIQKIIVTNTAVFALKKSAFDEVANLIFGVSRSRL